MCVGLPAKVKKVKDGVAVIDAGGAAREVSSEMIDGLEPGDYVMVHAGMAIAKITSSDEEETAEVMKELEDERS
ncbi:MAG: HypC/HybG/HupF family hydrogenase formation chaperone [Anaerovoracaceae bacterium]|jgi:hydrogenase expression/formation protein HypC